ncbi:hypothetical protein M0812_01531 [Anaeramoeba flamelloides]|uniref:Uncharacterized protein n=1 Tax=Anaeramoeba flamelloides TaxID=1746091 RepID=A0AAV7ZN90_9EUKA|nr:hypothetical protein M0812_01531 [Anaeramoeba flamelloides]
MGLPKKLKGVRSKIYQILKSRKKNQSTEGVCLEIIKLCAYLPLGKIPKLLLQSWINKRIKGLENVDLEVNRALVRLCKQYSIMHLDKNNQCLSFHKLFRMAAYNNIMKNDEEKILKDLDIVLNETDKSNPKLPFINNAIKYVNQLLNNIGGEKKSFRCIL